MGIQVTVSNNLSVRFLENIHHNYFGMFLSKYSILSLSLSVTEVKKWIWSHFVDDCIACNTRKPS